jgi:hypothetical protein
VAVGTAGITETGRSGRSGSTGTEGDGMAGRGAGAAEPEHGCRAISEIAEGTHLFGSTFDCLTAAVHPQVVHLQ